MVIINLTFDVLQQKRIGEVCAMLHPSMTEQKVILVDYPCVMLSRCIFESDKVHVGKGHWISETRILVGELKSHMIST